MPPTTPTTSKRKTAWTEPAHRLRRAHASRQQLRAELRQRYWLRAHIAMIALLTLAALWLVSALLMHAGVASLALRYSLACPVAYGVYLLLLRWWAGALARRESPLDGLDAPSIELPHGSPSSAGAHEPSFSSGGGGDFAGGGADAGWDLTAAEGIGEGIGNGLGSLAKGAGSVLDGLDEGAVVIVPLAVLLGLIALLGGLIGTGVLMMFGVEVLLAVAVEVGLASLAGTLAYKGFMEGWLSSALRHTWRGALAVLLLAVALGAVLDRWVPEARSLPHAARLIQG
ncbi:hypothetical protein [Aquabacterium soli]|uniref:hypothetical protein n=1 Tax=Aquabacterium soli TaxID=2493092 RepID=UPI001F48A3E1|nr:hypothetical protein [Aquabacterium soli]